MITVTAFARRFVPFVMGAILLGWGVLVPVFAQWHTGGPLIPGSPLDSTRTGAWELGFAWWDDLFVLVTGCYLLATAIAKRSV